MKKTIFVRAKHPGKPCPKEGRARVRWYEHASGEKRDRFCIYHDEPIEVPSSRYYRRRIRVGDLEQVKAPAPTPPREAAATETKPKPRAGKSKK